MWPVLIKSMVYLQTGITQIVWKPLLWFFSLKMNVDLGRAHQSLPSPCWVSITYRKMDTWLALRSLLMATVPQDLMQFFKCLSSRGGASGELHNTTGSVAYI